MVRRKLRPCYLCKELTTDAVLCCILCRERLKARPCEKCAAPIGNINPNAVRCQKCKHRRITKSDEPELAILREKVQKGEPLVPRANRWED